MHPFHPLDEKEEVIFDIYTSDGTLSMVQPRIEVRQYTLVCMKCSTYSAPSYAYPSALSPEFAGSVRLRGQ